MDASFIEPPVGITPWLLNGQAGDSWDVLTAGGSLTGSFAAPNLPIPAGLPTLPAGHVYRWKVIYDRTDAPDPELGSLSQPWAANGKRDVVIVLAEVALPDIARGERQAAGTSAAVGRVDLLTVLTHEIGHSLGLADENGQESAHSVMSDTLGLSTRRVPINGNAAEGVPYHDEAARNMLFSRLAIDAEAFTSSSHIRFAAPRAGRQTWLDGIDEFFARGGLEPW